MLDGGGQQAEEGWWVAPGVSQELDELKEQYCALPDFLTQLVRRGQERACCRWGACCLLPASGC